MQYERYLRHFADDLRSERLQRGLSREQLAERAGVHPNTIGVFERGERDISILSQIRILSALGCTDMLIEDDRYVLHFGGEKERAERTDLLAMPDSSLIRCIGEAIRTRRRQLGFRLEDLADMSDLHLNTVWNCERGLVVPDGYTIYRIYRSLGVSRLTTRKNYLSLD